MCIRSRFLEIPIHTSTSDVLPLEIVEVDRFKKTKILVNKQFGKPTLDRRALMRASEWKYSIAPEDMKVIVSYFDNFRYYMTRLEGLENLVQYTRQVKDIYTEETVTMSFMNEMMNQWEDPSEHMNLPGGGTAINPKYEHKNGMQRWVKYK